jgi:hypothetical protein
MEDVIETGLFKIFEVIYDDVSSVKKTLAYVDDSSRFYFTDFRGNGHYEGIEWKNVKGLNELRISEERVRTGDPVEIIYDGGVALAYFFEDVRSALKFNLPETRGYRNIQAIDRGKVKEVRKLVSAG